MDSYPDSPIASTLMTRCDDIKVIEEVDWWLLHLYMWLATKTFMTGKKSIDWKFDYKEHLRHDGREGSQIFDSILSSNYYSNSLSNLTWR